MLNSHDYCLGLLYNMYLVSILSEILITSYRTLIMIVRQNRIFAKFSDAMIIILTNSNSLRIKPLLNAILEGNL